MVDVKTFCSIKEIGEFKMKKFIALFTAIFICTINLFGQDKFTVRRLTSDPAQEGFAAWSPDGLSIVYQYADLSDTVGRNGLWKVSRDGTGVKQIFRGVAEHAKWSPDGKFIVFDADTGHSIKMIPAYGGDPISFLPDSIQIQNGGLPCWSPDGSQIAFLERKGLSICTYNLKTKELKSIFREEGMLPLLGGWWIDGKSILVALMDRKTRKSTIQRISTDGMVKKQIIGQHENFYRHLALSPDGSLLVYAVKEDKYLGLWIMPSEGGKSIPLAVTPDSHNEGAVWSPDGKRIAFTSTRSGNFDIWVMDADIEKIKKEIQMLQDSSMLTGPYLGQQPPGTTPEIFAKGIVSTDGHEFSCCFSPDGNEFYFARRNSKTMQTGVMACRQINGVWTMPEPETALLPEGFTFEPFVTPDHKKLYFQIGGVVDGKPAMLTKYVGRDDEGWGKIIDPGAPFNPMKTMHISATTDGTIYTTDISGGMGSESLGIMKKINGEYQKLEKLGSPFNKTEQQQHPWIAPDESYIIFTVRRPGKNPVSVLFVSFKDKEGKWSEPKEIDLGMDAGQPFVTYDGKYLFFTTGDPRKGSDIYWVSAKIIVRRTPSEKR